MTLEDAGLPVTDDDGPLTDLGQVLDAGIDSGIGPQDNGPLPITAVRITAPVDGELLTSAVNIVVEVDGGTADRVEIFVDDQLTFTLTEAPYEQFWSFVELADGPHEILAVATQAGEPLASAPVVVETDTAPPELTELRPALGADYVSGEPILLYLNERLGPDALETASVSVRRSGGVAVDATLEVRESDPTVVEVRPVAVAGPTQLTVQVNRVRDRGGRALAPVNVTYDVPVWGQLAPEVMPAGVTDLSLASPGDGTNRYVAALSEVAGTTEVRVYRWDSWRWEPLGGTACTTASAAEAGLWDFDLDESGRPVVTLLEEESGLEQRIRACRWDGSAWDESTPVYDAGADVLQFSMAVDRVTGDLALGVLSVDDLDERAVDIVLLDGALWDRIGPPGAANPGSGQLPCDWDQSSRLVCVYADFRFVAPNNTNLLAVERYDATTGEWEDLTVGTVMTPGAIAFVFRAPNRELLTQSPSSPYVVTSGLGRSFATYRYSPDEWWLNGAVEDGPLMAAAADGQDRLFGVTTPQSPELETLRLWRVDNAEELRSSVNAVNGNPAFSVPTVSSLDMAIFDDGKAFFGWADDEPGVTAYQYSGALP